MGQQFQIFSKYFYYLSCLKNHINCLTFQWFHPGKITLQLRKFSTRKTAKIGKLLNPFSRSYDHQKLYFVFLFNLFFSLSQIFCVKSRHLSIMENAVFVLTHHRKCFVFLHIRFKSSRGKNIVINYRQSIFIPDFISNLQFYGAFWANYKL